MNTAYSYIYYILPNKLPSNKLPPRKGRARAAQGGRATAAQGPRKAPRKERKELPHSAQGSAQGPRKAHANSVAQGP